MSMPMWVVHTTYAENLQSKHDDGLLTPTLVCLVLSAFVATNGRSPLLSNRLAVDIPRDC
ncbi:hypothetical protein EGR_08228 [Echinococcus granulosus]|uniref:Uncharacterized protein n=1 Tax=Echinococcus granulosus TaxID=6210 RepID=W6UFL5_ECHGR|nr:hypothetical protein EGR_08228 [Echinococcus granulosus]EUB56922.1 hypothetical protein EGR_08228 [Echinococcus granulosus]